MSNEELNQRGYTKANGLKGTKFGPYEELNIGGTNVRELKASGLSIVIPDTISFPFKLYKPPKNLANARPDRLFFQRSIHGLHPVAVAEHKAPTKLRTDKEQLTAAEQGLCAAAACNAKVAVISNGQHYSYINVAESLASGKLCTFDERRDFVPAVLDNLMHGSAGEILDPKPLADSVWQIIWQATKEEPKVCLLTFVEIFVLKFLSDNLPLSVLPANFRFEALILDKLAFQELHGKTAIEYYVESIRPRIKQLFPDNTVVADQSVSDIFGLNTLVSKTSVINGFAFLQSSTESLASFNRTFLEILNEFDAFGPLTTIDPQFKLRLTPKSHLLMEYGRFA